MHGLLICTDCIYAHVIACHRSIFELSLTYLQRMVSIYYYVASS